MKVQVSPLFITLAHFLLSATPVLLPYALMRFVFSFHLQESHHYLLPIPATRKGKKKKKNRKKRPIMLNSARNQSFPQYLAFWNPSYPWFCAFCSPRNEFVINATFPRSKCIRLCSCNDIRSNNVRGTKFFLPLLFRRREKSRDNTQALQQLFHL